MPNDTHRPPPILGYRQLDVHELRLVNELKAHAEKTRVLMDMVQTAMAQRLVESIEPEPAATRSEQLARQFDPAHFAQSNRDAAEFERWMRIAHDHLQQGFSAAVRAITRPTTY